MFNRKSLILDVVSGIGPLVHTSDPLLVFIFSNHADIAEFTAANPDLVHAQGAFADYVPVLFITKVNAKVLNIKHGDTGYDHFKQYGDHHAVQQSLERLKLHLSLPLPECSEMCGDKGTFDPWDIFPCFYGTYSGAFDKMAITVLERMRDREFVMDEGLSEEMFREYLCRNSIASYGTVPSVCFVHHEFEEILPTLIEKWRGYARIRWGVWGEETWPV